jgi:acyl-CoA thioesterase-1
LIGVLAIVISSTAISYWYYALTAIVTLAWIASGCFGKWRRGATIAFAVVWLVAALVELPYLITPSLSTAASRGITIVGDSVTAGVGGDEKSETWPKILAREHDLDVQDISHMGDTASSALKRVRVQGVNAPVVVVEIGGNDLLGSTTSAQFAQDLDALLTQLVAADRQIVMFELPLPPFCHEYGRIQRSLAAKHNVKLIPKRVFLAVVASSDSTLDSIHLSQTGHQQMADVVWGIVQSAYPTKSSK